MKRGLVLACVDRSLDDHVYALTYALAGRDNHDHHENWDVLKDEVEDHLPEEDFHADGALIFFGVEGVSTPLLLDTGVEISMVYLDEADNC